MDKTGIPKSETTKLLKDKYGICPIMSGPVVLPQKKNVSTPTVELTVFNFGTACVGPDCAMWDDQTNRCSFVTQPGLQILYQNAIDDNIRKGQQFAKVEEQESLRAKRHGGTKK